MGRTARSQQSRGGVSLPGGTDFDRSRLRRVGVALLCSKVSLVPLVLDPTVDWPFVVPKALLSHALAYAVGAVLLGILIRFGRRALLWSPLHVPVITFLAVSVLATTFAVDPYLAAYGAHNRMLGLGTLADWVVLYVAAVLLVRTRRESLAVVASALAASVLVLGYEFLQVIGKDPFQWSRDATDRAFSTIGQPTSLAQYTTTLAVAAFAFALLQRDLRRALRVGLVALAGALLWGTAATDTRAPVVGLIAGGCVLILATWLTGRPEHRVRTVALGAAASCAALAALLLFTPIGARLAATIRPDASGHDSLLTRLEHSAAGRIALYEIAAQEVLERPLFGYGPENFVRGVPRYRPEAAEVTVRQSAPTSAHSVVIQVAATTGLLGLASFLAMLAVAFWLAFRSHRQPVALVGAATLAAFIGTGLVTIDDVGTGWLMWASLGAIAGSTARRDPPAQSSSGNRHLSSGRRQRDVDSQGRRFASTAISACGVLALLIGSAALDASRSAKASSDARLTGNVSAAVAAGNASVRADPGRAEYWHTLGLAYLSAQRLPDAIVALDRARKLASNDAGYTGDLVRAQLILSQSGDAGARSLALQMADDLARSDPNNPRAHYTRAVALQVAGNIPEAVRAIERALALDPDSTNPILYITAIQLYVAAGRAPEAVSVGRAGIAAIGPTKVPPQLRDELDRALAAMGQPPDPRPDLGACTSTGWTANPSSPQPSGGRVSFTIAVAGCERQESQIAVVAPGASSSVLLSGGAWESSHTWDTSGLGPGTYRVLLYTRRVGWAGPYQAFYEGEYVLSR